MVNIFKYIDKFFISLTNYLTYNWIFIIFGGLFLLTAVLVIISTSRSYESRLIKAIDHFNAYFMDNPQINENNLVMFNEKMKSKRVPKHLRKAWQQFVLYREGKASDYMSFDACVTSPIRNSTFTRDVKTMNLLAWIFSICSFVLNCYYCFETIDLASVLRSAALTPALILLVNYIIQIFLNLRHSAVVSDLTQNYQYFEVNMDKATETLPEYVDYEVLFDRNEIKRGIPILYTYLQKRAEHEQRELEMARLKNIEHEKFNFDDQGIAASLVLERAMQEAENYIAERKKYMQDIEQINADMTQEDMNYREITKEYNRQMQVSRETFANFKAQLEEVSSSIEANYLKKQQQQELDRQRNLERDFDAATERHKTVIESFHLELDEVDKLIAESRNKLEEAMKSEFSTYSGKVYDEAKVVVEDREKELHARLKQNIINLEETLVSKNEEIEKLYQTNQLMNDKLLDVGISFNGEEFQSKNDGGDQPQVYQPSTFEEQGTQEEETPFVQEYKPLVYAGPQTSEDEPEVQGYKPLTYEAPSYIPEYEREEQPVLEEANVSNETEDNLELDEPEENQSINLDRLKQLIAKAQEELNTVDDAKQEEDFEEEPEKEIPVKKKAGRPRKEQQPVVEEKRGRGRPRKEVKAEPASATQPKKSVGRPKKVQTQAEVVVTPSKGRGRPRKTEQPQTSEVKKSVGRPRKESSVTPAPAAKRGRPKKAGNANLDNIKDIKDIDEYLKKIDNAIAVESARLQESEKELNKKSKLKPKR